MEPLDPFSVFISDVKFIQSHSRIPFAGMIFQWLVGIELDRIWTCVFKLVIMSSIHKI